MITHTLRQRLMGLMMGHMEIDIDERERLQSIDYDLIVRSDVIINRLGYALSPFATTRG
jgi:hypothetical protein